MSLSILILYSHHYKAELQGIQKYHVFILCVGTKNIDVQKIDNSINKDLRAFVRFVCPLYDIIGIV